jgi:signal transduction histidine kinase
MSSYIHEIEALMQGSIALRDGPAEGAVLRAQLALVEREDLGEVQRQAQRIVISSPLLREILDAVPDIMVVLNSRRQIVFGNRSLLAFGQTEDEAMLGLRPGEALDCSHAAEQPGGCGTAECCSLCGVLGAILASQAGQNASREFRITRRQTGEALDFRVGATPLTVDGEQFTLFTLSDIGNEKRRRALERVFFHDILNTAVAMRASAGLLRRAGTEAPGDLPDLVLQLSDRLIDEISLQRQLSDAENNELAVIPVNIDVPGLLQGLAATHQLLEIAQGRQVRVAEPVPDVPFFSDRTLLRRILGNLLKNALEASPAGAEVTLGCEERSDGLEFWVHNPGSMPRDVQLQIFQRSYSTKGPGRGLGTYGARLLTERYLNGRIWFTSTRDAGTTFRACCPRQIATN